jgi:hypothetical protein
LLEEVLVETVLEGELLVEGVFGGTVLVGRVTVSRTSAPEVVDAGPMERGENRSGVTECEMVAAREDATADGDLVEGEMGGGDVLTGDPLADALLDVSAVLDEREMPWPTVVVGGAMDVVDQPTVLGHGEVGGPSSSPLPARQVRCQARETLAMEAGVTGSPCPSAAEDWVGRGAPGWQRLQGRPSSRQVGWR